MLTKRAFLRKAFGRTLRFSAISPSSPLLSAETRFLKTKPVHLPKKGEKGRTNRR